MIDLLRKQQLYDGFFQNDALSENLTEQEQTYINTLSMQWNQALLRLYGEISERDSISYPVHKEPSSSPNREKR